MPTAFKATYSDWKLVKTRGVIQIVFEVPLAEADSAYEILGGMPAYGKERWFGIAAIKAPQQEEDRAEPRPSARPTPPTDGAARGKMDWRDLQPSAQAALRCEQPPFWAFLREVHGYVTVHDTEGAASAVRHLCVAKSRSEFSTDQRKRVLWKQLDDQFQAWKVTEHA